MIDLNQAMRELASSRPVFHSEADFQHALAITIRDLWPETSIRLEYRPLSNERVYLDLWVTEEDQRLAIELKYKTRAARLDWLGERFDLANHGAQDLGAYDVWKDVQRLEAVCTLREGVVGYVVCLTNDPTYWRQPVTDNTVGAAFRLHEGRTATGGLYWAAHAGQGTIKNRETPISLSGSYRIAWNDYSRLGSDPGLSLRYAIIPVAPATQTIGDEAVVPPISVRLEPQLIPQITKTGRRSKYSPLRDYLIDTTSDRVELTYGQIEEIIKAPLPPSSRNHAAVFWANHYGGTHVWATCWMDAGWKVAGHSVTGERVTFERVSEPRV